MLLARRTVLLTTATFVTLLLLAMRLYPGGTTWNPRAAGHDFWLNFLCDLARPTALNGVPNPTGSALAQSAMIALAIGLVPFWSLLGGLAQAPRVAMRVRVLGGLATLGVVAVVLLPGDRFGVWHGIACVCAAIPGLAAAATAVRALLGSSVVTRAARVVGWMGAATLGLAAACFVLYLPDVFRLCSALMAVAVLERASLGLLILWMLVCCAACRTS